MNVQQQVVFLALGLAGGAVYASLAMALVVTYRSSGVLNFATGANAALGAYFYAFLRQGELFIPIPGLPETVSLGTDSLGLVPAMMGALLLSALFGLLLYAAVFRYLRSAPVVARAVASFGVMLVIIELLGTRVSKTPISAPIFPTGTWRVFGTNVRQDSIWVALTIVVVAVALSALFRFTRFGLATRAAAESERGAFVTGLAPEKLAAANWMISAAVAGLAGILISPNPSTALNPISYSLFVVPALAAAIVGKFQKLLPAVAAGLVMGMVISDVAFFQARYDFLPQSGMTDLIPLVVVMLAFVIRAHPLPSRGEVIRPALGRAPRAHRPLLCAAVGLSVGVVAILSLPVPWRQAFITSLIFGVISLSLVVITGYAGQISLAQLTLAGVAGFILGPLTTDWTLPIIHTSVPFPIAPLLAALLATVIGVIVGLPALRIRGLPVAVVTLSLAVCVESLWFRNTDYVSVSGKVVSGPELFGLDLRNRVGTSYARIPFGLLALLVLVGVALYVVRLRRSRLGSAMLAVRANERSAAASGIDVVRTKLIAFAIGSFLAGLGGSLFAYSAGTVTFNSFVILLGLSVFATTYLAGITSVSGGVVAGFLCANGLVYKAATDWVSLGDYYGMLAGIGLVYTVIRNPEGIVGPFHALLARRRASAEGPEVPVPVPVPVPVAPVPAPAVHGRPDLLSIRGVSVRYGGNIAVNDFSIDVAEGSIVGLIGPNGAGKTTLLDALSGFVPATGSIVLDGKPMGGLRPYQRARAGMGRTFQAIELYDDLSAAENVAIGLSASARATTSDAVAEAFAMLGLTQDAERPAADLSQGRRRLLSVARALVGRPRILLLDEPAAGLDSTESLWLGDRLRDIRAGGTTILLIDHDMSLVMSLCDQLHVLDFGRLLASGGPSTIQADPKVAAAYLGTTHARVREKSQ